MGKVDIEDPSTFNHKFVNLDCDYVDEGPVEGPVLLLLHGFPELWYCWKYQIPYFSNLGFRVIVPDMIGYGQTTLSPKISENLETFSFKFSSLALHSLIYDHILKNRKKEKFNILGHDFGSLTTWFYTRMFPDTLNCITCLSVPFIPPTEKYIGFEEQVKHEPVLGYQLSLIESDPKKIDSELEDILDYFWRCKFTKVEQTFGLHVPKGKSLLEHKNSLDHILLDNFPGQKFMKYMYSQYKLQGFKGPVNWYRTTKINFENDIPFLDSQIHVPALTIVGKNDFTYKFIEDGKSKCKDLQIETIEKAGHWIQIGYHKQVNSLTLKFLKEKLGPKFPNLPSNL